MQFFKPNQSIIPFPGRLIDDCYEENKALKSLLMNKPILGCQIETSMNVHDSAILEDSLPPKEKDQGSWPSTIVRSVEIICAVIIICRGAGDLGVATPRAWVYAVVMTSTGMLLSLVSALAGFLSVLRTKAAALSPSSFPKRYRSSYETPSPSSSPTLPIRKRYQGTSELVEDIKDESLDSDTEREGSEDKGPGSEEEEVAPEGRQQVAPAKDTAVDEPLGLGYEALRRRELVIGEGEMPSMFEVGQSSRSVSEHEGAERISAFRQPTLITWVDLEDGRVYTDIPTYVPPAAPVQTSPSPEWSFGSLPLSPSSPVVPTLIASPMTTPAATIPVDEDEFLKVGVQLKLHESILHDHT
ncbi:hypothetical protein Tco_1393738 [Tanacetum coccineum]